MPSLENTLPKLNQKALTRRQGRAIRVLNDTKQLHAAMIVCQLRREERALQRDFWQASSPSERQSAHRSLLAARGMLLQIICWPKPAALRPGQTPGETLNRAGRLDLTLAPVDAVEVPPAAPVPPPMDSPVAPLAPHPL